MKDITFWRSLRSGFMGMVSKLNRDERMLFTRYGREVDENTKKTIDREHWFLFIIGVDTDLQRRGYGKDMIEAMLRRIDGEKLPIMLDTNKRKNVAYYEKFGFEVKRTYNVLGNDHWGLVRGGERNKP
jgi:ribosomal protein S18 acetylase RimI-like enzyme